MKTIIRFFSMLALVGGIAVTGALAQNPCDDVDTPTGVYTTFTQQWTPLDATLKANKPPTEAALQEAINTGKGFLEKWGACEAWAQQAKFVSSNVKRFEDAITKVREFGMYDRLDKAIAADNTAEIYAAGKEIMAKNPDNVNVHYVLAVAANREAAKKNNAFNADAIRYARTLLDKMKAGTAKLTKKNNKGQETIGALKYEYPREDAMSELAYTIAYLTYYGQNDKKGGIQQYYQVAQMPGFRKNYAPVYATIGDYYIAEAAPIGQQIADLIAKQKAAATDEEKLKLDEEIKAKVALFNGYTERALDAYGRAWNVAADNTPEAKKYKDGLLAIVKDLYKRRFEKDAGAEQWVATAIAKPLPDPTSPVQPVSDPEPTTTTTTTTGAGTGVGAANGSGVGAANGKGVGAANGSGVGNGAAAKNSAAKTTGGKTSAAKSPAAKTTAAKPRK